MVQSQNQTPIENETYDRLILALTKHRDAISDRDGWVNAPSTTLATLEAYLANVLTEEQGKKLTEQILDKVDQVKLTRNNSSLAGSFFNG